MVDEFHNSEISTKEYMILRIDEKKGLFNCEENCSSLLPCEYDAIETIRDWDSYCFFPGLLTKRDGLFGYYHNKQIILPNEYDEIDFYQLDGSILICSVQRRKLFGVIQVDLSNNTYKEVIPVEYEELRKGHRLIAIRKGGKWKVYKTWQKGREGITLIDSGLFNNITTDYSEPYPTEDGSILLPLNRGTVGADWKRADQIFENTSIEEGYKCIRTVFLYNGLWGIWENEDWRVISDTLSDGIYAIQVATEGTVDSSVFIIKKNEKKGLYNAKIGAYTISCIFDDIIVTPNEDYIVVLNNHKGIINCLGTIIIKPVYEDIIFIHMDVRCDYGFGDGVFTETKRFYQAKKDNQYELYSTHGNRVFEGTYDSIAYIVTRPHRNVSDWYYLNQSLIFRVSIDGKEGLFDEDGFQFFLCEYESITYDYDSDTLITHKNNVIEHIPFIKEVIRKKKLAAIKEKWSVNNNRAGIIVI